MDISKLFLNKFLPIIVFFATLGFGNQNQIEQLLKTIDKSKNLTGYISLLENQSQNNFSYTRTSSPIAVHNSRDDFTSILVDSAKNGYGFFTDVTDPLAWASGVGFLLSYRQWADNQHSGYIGAAESNIGEEWFVENGINTTYPAGEEEPNLPTADGHPQGRYPSSIIGGSTEDDSRGVVIWNEETNTSYGGTNDGGFPLWSYDALPLGEDYYFSNPWILNSGCATIPCDPPDLWLPQTQKIFDSNGNTQGLVLLQEGKSSPEKFWWIRSSFYTNGYFLWDDPMLLFDFSDGEIISDYAGRPKFNVNDNGIGYFVFSGYGTGYDSGGSLLTHTFFFLKTTNHGETWESTGETFNGGNYSFIPDESLNLMMTEAGLLGGTVLDGIGNEVTLDQAFMGYNYQVRTDNAGGLHITSVVLPKYSGSDSLYVGTTGAGYYDLYNPNPDNPATWSASLIRDMSASYKTELNSSLPTWQYLYNDIAVSTTGGTIWSVTSAIRELIPLGNNEYTYDDIDLFGSVSFNDGQSWIDLGNITDTPSGGTDGTNFELHPHLAPISGDMTCYVTFQMPDMNNGDGPNYEDYKNRIYFSTIGTGTADVGASITITEIMQNPSAVSDDEGEWFEILNTGDIGLDLGNWVIKDAGSDNHTISTSFPILPGEYKVFGKNSNFATNGGVIVDYQYEVLTLANSNDELILIDPNGTVFDSVAYDNGETFPDPTGASMALVHPDSNNNIGSNWQEATTSYGSGDLGTPGLPNFSSDIEISIATIDFDTVYVGQSGDMTLSISNIGNTLLDLDSVYTMTDVFSVPFTQTSIDNSLDLVITFTPSIYGTVEDILVLITNDPDESHLEIPLVGFGYVPSPNIVLESTSIDFGTVMDGLTETVEFHVANTGDVSLSISSVYIEGSTNFTVLSYSESITENDTGSIEIKFSPDDETSFSGTLYIVSNDPDTDTLMVSLNGNGGEQAPFIVLSDDELYFGTVQSGTTVEKELTIYNEGMLDLEIEEVTIDGSDFYTTTFSDATIEPGDSVVVAFSFAPTEQVTEVLATATVASNIESKTIELIAGYFGPVWYVATNGSNEYMDGSAENPFPMIEYAIQCATDGDTIMIANGNYGGEAINFGYGNENKKNIHIIGESMDSTIFSPELNTGVAIYFTNGLAGNEWSDSTYIHIENLTIMGKVYFFDVEQVSLSSIKIISETHSPLMIAAIGNYDNYNPLYYISNSIFINDSDYNTLIAGTFSEFEINHSTFIGAVTFETDDNSNPIEIISSIIWGENIQIPDSLDLNVSFSNFKGGFDGEGNINIDPLFCDPENGDYSLAANSPALGAGENGTNMGALGVGCESTELSVDKNLIPAQYTLHQNYPNPFNPVTTLHYDLPENGLVNITIYDIMGRIVKTLVNSSQTAGYKSIQWNATNDRNESVSAGLYLYTIQAGEFRQTKKMVLLK